MICNGLNNNKYQQVRFEMFEHLQDICAQPYLPAQS